VGYNPIYTHTNPHLCTAAFVTKLN
jgi:hypothetical protein